MWKRLLVTVISLIGTFSIVYGIQSELLAGSNVYHTGGEINGRVHKAPAGIHGTKLAFQKGDRIYMGTENPATNQPLSWQLVRYDQSYTDYGCSSVSTSCVQPEQSAWLSFSDDAVGLMDAGLTSADYSYVSTTTDTWALYTTTRLSSTIHALNSRMKATADDAIIGYRNLTSMHYVAINKTSSYNVKGVVNASMFPTGMGDDISKGIFTPNTYEYIAAPFFTSQAESSYILETRDLKFKSDYWGTAFGSAKEYPDSAIYFKIDGTRAVGKNYADIGINGTKKDLRPAVYLDVSDVVFAVSRSNTAGLGQIIAPALSSNYTNLSADARGEPMKVRLEDQNLTATTAFHGIQHRSGSMINTVEKNTDVFLDITAIGAASDAGVNTISVLIFDAQGEFLYYQPLDTTSSGRHTYALDTSNLPVGAYQIAIVNECYNDSQTYPTKSSALIGPLSLKLVQPLTVSVTQTPQLQSTFEYHKNVSYGDQIATIAGSGGVAPITYAISKDSSIPGHELDDQKFKVDTSGGVPKIVVNEPMGLSAGTYRFIVSALDVNGDPIDTDGQPAAKTSVSITVEKTTPTIAFVDSTLRNVPYVSGSAFTENILHDNTDANAAVSYGASNAILSASKETNSNHARITVNSTGLTGTADVTASLAETENFKAAVTKKTINVYNGINNLRLEYAKTPITALDTLSANYTIGKIRFDGGVGNFIYEIAEEPGDAAANADGSKFSVSSTATSARMMDVKTTQPLNAGIYQVTIKISDAFKNAAYYKARIVVQAGEVSGFEFYEDAGFTTIKTNQVLRVPYGSMNTTLYAGGGTGTGSISYRLQAGQAQNIIQITNAATGTYTIQKTGSIIVEAVKAADANFAEKVISMTLQIDEGEQTVAFQQTVPSQKKLVLDDTMDISATLTRPDASTGALLYSAGPSSVCVVEDSTVPVLTMKGKGICTIKAENTDAYYVDASDTKTITLYEGITGTFVQVVDPLAQGDPAALAGSGTVIAKTTALAGGTGTFTFSNMKASKDGVDVTSRFQMDQKGNISAKANLLYGTYQIEITLEDGNKETSIIQGVIRIELEKNTGFALTEQGKAVSEIERDYIGAQNPKITLDTQGKKGPGAVTYALSDDSHKDPKESSEAITVDPTTGIISVHRAMTSDDVYKVYAYIDQDTLLGYAKQITQTVSVHIIPSPQQITFDPGIPNSIRFAKDKAFAITANLDRPDGRITYSTSSNGVCVIDDPTKPVARAIGTGYCVIRAENSDANFEYVSQVKSILLTDGMSAVFTQVLQPLKQGDPALQPATRQTIAKIASLAGQQGTVSYRMTVYKGLLDVSHQFQIDTNGEIAVQQAISYGTYDVAVTLRDDTGADGEVIISGQIAVGLEENSAFALTYDGKQASEITATFTDAVKGMQVAVTGQKGNGKVYYAKTADSNTNALEIQGDGTIIVHSVMKPGELFKVYAYVQEDSINGYARQETVPLPILITNASMGTLTWQMDGRNVSEIHDVYDPRKTISLGIGGLPANSTVTYRLLDDGDGTYQGVVINDVITIDSSTGAVAMLHASLPVQIGKVKIVAEAACDGYDPVTMQPIDVSIEKANQSTFQFAQSTYTMPNGTGSFSPVFVGGVPHDDGVTYNNKLSCPDPYDVRVDASKPDTFTYDVTDAEGASIVIEARNLGNRDYNAIKASAILRILKAGESLFDVDVSPSRVIKYGDTVTLTPDVVEGAGVSYTYTSEDTTILKQDQSTANVFHGAGVGIGSIKVKKTEAGKADAEAVVTIRVNPKPVDVEADGPYEIKTGQAIPAFTLKPYPAGAILNNDQLPQPQITTAAQDSLTVGRYPITVTYPVDDVTKNYSFQQKPIDLIITQDQSEASWFKAYKKSDSEMKPVKLSDWFNEPLIIESIHPSYNHISKNGKNNWQETLELSQEGEYDVPMYFKDSSNGALSSSLLSTIRIDYTGPEITAIEAQDTNTHVLARMLNALTFQAFYKPGVEVIIRAEDLPVQGAAGSSGVKEVSYRIDSLKNGQVDQNIKIEPGASTSDEVKITLSQVGEYRVCATAVDMVGNVGNEKCKDLKIKKIDVDVDGDGYPDFNDSNQDGCPDLNIKWRDPADPTTWIIMNGDRDYDGIPDLNIDANGDGKADLNIDTDNDGIPDINLVRLSEKDWKEPKQCVTSQPETYCTGTAATAQMNIDLDINDPTSKGYHIPDINLITNGPTSSSAQSWKADFNISFDGKTPYLNIGKVPNQWKPNKEYTIDGFVYKTMDTLTPILNTGIIDDKYPSLNVDTNSDGAAEVNIDLNNDGRPELNIDGDGDGKPDINIDHDGDGKPEDVIMDVSSLVWKPDKLVDGDVPYMTMKLAYKGIDRLEDSGIIVEDKSHGFLPSFALRVNDVSSVKQQEIETELSKQDKHAKVEIVYEILLMKDGAVIQPNGPVTVSIPINKQLQQPRLLIQNKDGTFALLDAHAVGGYYVVETDYLGVIAVVEGDEKTITQQEPDPQSPDQMINDPQTDVQGTYDPYPNTGSYDNLNGIGGALTGDTTTILTFMLSGIIATMWLVLMYRKGKN